MALKFSSLNTGSNGNCFYIGTDTSAILIDAGLSCKETIVRLARLGLDISSIKAVFITHEHTDHIKGLTVIAKKYKLPIYITERTYLNGKLALPAELINTFNADCAIEIGGLKVLPFKKIHDAADPHSFVVSAGGVKVGVFTDLGDACDNLIKHFSQCNAAFLEANYDNEMLRLSSYPYFLKMRISGGRGHLSNEKALALVKAHKPPFMSHLLLSHLSNQNNCPKLVQSLFEEIVADDTLVVVAPRTAETPLYEISVAPSLVTVS